MHMEHEALISIKVFSNTGTDLIKEILKILLIDNTVDSISSVFKVNRVYNYSGHIHDLRNQEHFLGLTVAVLLRTELNPQNLIKKLQSIEKEEKLKASHNKIKINLLTFDDLVKMTPSLTIPHPEFHLKPEEIFPAAEIYGDFIHPVMRLNLTALSRQKNISGWGEFFAQGRSLL